MSEAAIDEAGSAFAATPEPPYYAVIFTSRRRAAAPDDGYDEAATRMEALARQQPGFLGMESARDGLGITVSYWRDLDSVHAWKRVAEHAEAQRRGRESWYERYEVRVARVERSYAWTVKA